MEHLSHVPGDGRRYRPNQMNDMNFTLPEFGTFVYDAEEDEHRSIPISLSIFNFALKTLVLVGYADDERPDDFIDALQNLRTRGRQTLHEASAHLNRYWCDCKSYLEEDEQFEVSKIDDLWMHIHPGDTVYISRRSYGDKKIYAQIECSCEWEREHGLQLVLREGLVISKLGPFDGHLTNSDAYDDPSLETIVYHGRSD